MTVTPIPPLATTVAGDAADPAAPPDVADPNPPLETPSTAPFALPGQTVTVDAAAVTVTVTAPVAFVAAPASPPAPTVMVCRTVSVTVWATPTPRRLNMLMKPSARFTLLLVGAC
jgi:hypothetical protein